MKEHTKGRLWFYRHGRSRPAAVIHEDAWMYVTEAPTPDE